MISDYFEKLEVIRDTFEKLCSDFPVNYCAYATRAVYILTGLEEVSGIRVNCPDYQHACNYDREEEIYVDITADQFKDCNERLFFFRKGPIFVPIKQYTKFQRNSNGV